MLSENWFCDLAEEGAQYGLLALMSGISEEMWCAGWLVGLEFSCWQARESGPMRFGMGEITQRQCDLLRLLSEEANGWWVYKGGPVFVPLDEWREKVAALKAQEAQDETR